MNLFANSLRNVLQKNPEIVDVRKILILKVRFEIDFAP